MERERQPAVPSERSELPQSSLARHSQGEKAASTFPSADTLDRFGARRLRSSRAKRFERYDRFNVADPYEDLPRSDRSSSFKRVRGSLAGDQPYKHRTPDALGESRSHGEGDKHAHRDGDVGVTQASDLPRWLLSLLALAPLTGHEVRRIVVGWRRGQRFIAWGDRLGGRVGRTLWRWLWLVMVYALIFATVAGISYAVFIAMAHGWPACSVQKLTCFSPSYQSPSRAKGGRHGSSRFPSAAPSILSSPTPGAGPTVVATPISDGLPADPPIPTLCPDGATPTPGINCTPCDWRGWQWTHQAEPTLTTMRQALLNAARSYRLPPRLLGAVAARESHWQENILSCSYDAGFMQIKVAYWRALALQTIPACGLEEIHESPWTLQGNVDLGAKLVAWIRCYFEFAGDTGGTLANPGLYTSAWYYAQARRPYPDVLAARSYCAAIYQAHVPYQGLGLLGALDGFSCPYTPSATDWTLLDITVSAYNEGMAALVSQGIQNWSVYVQPIEASLGECVAVHGPQNALQRAICSLPAVQR